MTWPEAPERPALTPPPDPDAPPARRLAGAARFAWGVHQAGIWIVATLIGSQISDHVHRYGTLFIAVPLALLAITALVLPPLRYSRWRWDLRPDAIDIRHGTFTVRRTLIPLSRVQHVDTRRGLLEQALELATVVVHTAAGAHTIPYLSEFDADELRDRIAALARTDA
jgi:membrane protein YdbS with pleckstrin-like domain